jgi:hypothetical protein
MLEWNMRLLIAYLPVSSQNIAKFSTGVLEVFNLFAMTITVVESSQALISLLSMGNVSYVNTVVLRCCINTSGNSALYKS